jgi:hypothetical protein
MIRKLGSVDRQTAVFGTTTEARDASKQAEHYPDDVKRNETECKVLEISGVSPKTVTRPSGRVTKSTGFRGVIG